MNTPIGFFTFNRLDTVKVTFESIKKIKPDKLYLVSDGPRSNVIGEKELVFSVRKYIEDNIDWNCEVYKNYSDSNLGCKKRMASGISWILENEEYAIFMEDDINPSNDFFPYMEELLIKYKNAEEIMCVSGFKNLTHYKTSNSYLFSKYAMIWGWGTWRRAWNKYDVDIIDWEENKRTNRFRKHYNFFGYKVLKRDFDSVYNHKKDTWDFQWQHTLLDNNGLCIIPSENLIENIGFNRIDATHTNSKTDQDFTYGKLSFPLKHPNNIDVDEKYDKLLLKKNWGILSIAKKVIKRIITI